MRIAGLVIAGILLAPGCGGPCECEVEGARSGTGTGTGTGTGSDAEVEAGAGWTRETPGTWRFAVDADRAVETALFTSVGSRTMLTIPLPSGARGATVSKVVATYAEAGAGTWTVHPVGADGYPGEPLGSIKATVSGGRWADVSFDPPPAVSDRFVLMFEATDGAPALAAINAPMEGARLQQQLPGDMLNDVTMTPLVRVVLTNVH